MKYHACPFSNQCDAYKRDKCEGCAQVQVKTATDARECKFHDGDKVFVKNLKDGDPRSYLAGKVCTIRKPPTSHTTIYGIVEDENFLFDEHELERAYVFKNEDMVRAKFGIACDAFEAAIRNDLHTQGSITSRLLLKEEKKMASNTNVIINKYKPGWSIKRVIFNAPYTIVLWHDGDKTIVKCENEVYDPEKGLAMALSKKMLGNKSSYFDVFKKWLPEDYVTPASKKEAKPWHIWIKEATEHGVINGVHNKEYKRKNDATRVANKLYADRDRYPEVIVSMANPWKEV